MFITDLAIKRPVFSTALSLMIIIIGFLSYTNLSLQQYPEVEEPVLTIDTHYHGAAPAVVESKITNILEETLASTPGLDYMESASKTGQSQITLYFREGVSINEAASDAREKVSQIRSSLPKDCDDPAISKNAANQDPFLYLSFSSPHIPELELYDYADRNLKAVFESLPGVGSVELWGNATTMQVRLDREKLKAYNLAVTDIIQVLTQESKDLPAGSIIKGKRYVNIVMESSFNSPKTMGELIITNDHGHLVRLKDLATLHLGRDVNEQESISRCNKKPTVFLAFKKASGGNILNISTTVSHVLTSLKKTLPDGMNLDMEYNKSMFIEASIKAVMMTIFEAIVLVLLIILFFLHSPRAALIPLLTIPVSLIGSFAFLYAFHCSLNTITLLAMVLAIGLVVDDAIVVLENIHRHIERGLTPLEAAFKGAREVGFAVIAMTITLASVYTPIAFAQGLTGKLFAEFAVSLAGAVLISGVVALTLSPMMCAMLLSSKKKENRHKVSRLIEEGITKVEEGYQKALQKALTYPKVLSGFLLLVFLSGIFLFTKLPSEMAPQEDEGVILSVVHGPANATLETMFSYAQKLETLLTSIPESQGSFTVTRRSEVFGGVTLKPWGKRKRSFLEIFADLDRQAKSIAGAQVNIFPPQGLMTGGQSGLQMGIKTTGSYATLEKDMDKLVKRIKEFPCFAFVYHDLFVGVPQLNVTIDRKKAALLGVKGDDIAETLSIMLSGHRTITFEKEGKHYKVVIHALDTQKHDLRDVGNFYVKSETSQTLLPLSNFITIAETAVPTELKHLNKMRSSTLSANLMPDCHMEKGLTLITQAMKETLPPTFQWEALGNLRKFLDSQGEMYMMFCAALLFIYLVLAIQFESLLDPLLIMVTVPLSMTGALLALYLAGGTLNIFSQVGLITLVGLITKHGILLVEFANKQRKEGLSVVDAALQATRMRLRPILMTTGAMVLGSIPLALASGAGAESRQQIGLVLVGGLLGGTFFTLFAVPFVYTMVKGRKIKFPYVQR